MVEDPADAELGACPPIVWASPTKYYPEKLIKHVAAPDSSTACRGVGLAPTTLQLHARPDTQSSKALLLLQERLFHAGESNKQQLAEAAIAFKRQLADVQAAAASKAECLQEHLVQQCRRRRQQQMLSSCMSAWRCCQHKQQKQKQQAQLLALVLQDWLQAATCSRQQRQELEASCLHSWRLLVQQAAAAARRVAVLRQRRAYRVLRAWLQHSSAAQELALQSLQRAGWWHRRRLLHRCYSSWKQACTIKRQQVQAYVAQRQAMLLSAAVEAWQHCAEQQRRAAQAQLLQQTSDAATCSRQLQQAWRAWRQQLSAGLQRARQHRERHLMHAAVETWALLPSANLRLRAIGAAVGSTYRQLLLTWGLRAFCSCCSEAVAARRSARQCIRAWGEATAASARQRHLIRARAAARRRSVLQACFSCWLHAAWTTCRQAAAVQSSELKAAVVCAKAQATARQLQLDSLTAHQQALLQLVHAAARAALPELPLVPALQWHSLPAAAGSQQLLQPRARHACFALSALQPQQPTYDELCRVVDTQQAHQKAEGQLAASAYKTDSRSTSLWGAAAGLAATAQPPTGVLGCLVVFGGVTAGGGWLHDVSLLLMSDDSSTQGGQAGCCVELSHVLPSNGGEGCSGGSNGSDSSGSSSSSGSGSSSGVPVRVCDFAACESGPDSFVVVGGFDGSRNSLLLQRCVLTHAPSASSLQAATAPQGLGPAEVTCASTHASHAATQPTGQGLQLSPTSGWASGWRCSWEVLQPRNTTPLGRCHHSCCWHPGSRSLVVFGGYGNKRGCLDDVQVYNLAHREWWQPPRDAGQGLWPCGRRSHAAVVLGDGLWVHGGLTSSGQHLGDLWRLDLNTWTWQEVAGQMPGTVGSTCRPSPRRGHCLVAAQGRFLLLHGGYSGTCDLLGDAWVFCTHMACWLPVVLTAASGDQPVARALHTVTHTANRFMVVGGQTSLGPLSEVCMLCSPGTLHAHQWQQHSLKQQQELVELQQQNSQLQEQLGKRAAEAEHGNITSTVLRQQAAAAEALAAGLSKDVAALHRAHATAKEAAAAAEATAAAAAEQVQALERRLERARQGGIRALHAAAEATAQLQAQQQLGERSY